MHKLTQLKPKFGADLSAYGPKPEGPIPLMKTFRQPPNCGMRADGDLQNDPSVLSP